MSYLFYNTEKIVVKSIESSKKTFCSIQVFAFKKINPVFKAEIGKSAFFVDLSNSLFLIDYNCFLNVFDRFNNLEKVKIRFLLIETFTNENCKQ